MNDSIEKHWQKLHKESLKKISFMNNTKWLKLFQKINENNVQIYHSTIKYLMFDKMYEFHFHTDFDDTGILDGANCPALFKEIEWIFIPKTYEIERFNREEKLTSQWQQNDIELIKYLIDCIGKYEYDFDNHELKIYGYK